jgi:hypothetical protein
MKFINITVDKLPVSCEFCTLINHEYGRCSATKLIVTNTLIAYQKHKLPVRPSWCPLKEPEPQPCSSCHGTKRVQISSLAIEGILYVDMAPCPECEE